MSDPIQDVDAASRIIRGCRNVVLRADDRVELCKYVLDEQTGRPVLCVPSAVLSADEHVLFIPDESPESLQLLTIPEPLDDASDACCDRWRMYHGDAPHARFVRFAIDCARLGPLVFDGERLANPNELRRDVAGLCAHFNRRAEDLVTLCRRAGARTPQPGRLVGVDAFGFDVRTKFAVLRFEFGDKAANRDEAQARIGRMLDESEGA